MVVDIVIVEKRSRVSVAAGRKITYRLVTLEPKSSSVQGLIARSREGQRTEFVRGMCRSAQSGNLAFDWARNSASIFNVEYGCKSQSQVQKALAWGLVLSELSLEISIGCLGVGADDFGQ